MKNKEEIVNLVDQLLAYSLNSDKDHKSNSTKAADIVGNDFMTFHLKMLKDLINDE